MEPMDENKKSKSKGAVRRFGGWWTRSWVRSAGQGLRPNELAGNVPRLKARLQGLSSLRQNRDPEKIKIQTFDEMLKHWGITRREVPAVIRNLLIEVAIFIFLAATSLGTAMWAMVEGRGWVYFIYPLLMLPLAGTVALSRIWRVCCLKSETFIPFRVWLTGKEASGENEQ